MSAQKKGETPKKAVDSGEVSGIAIKGTVEKPEAQPVEASAQPAGTLLSQKRGLSDSQPRSKSKNDFEIIAGMSNTIKDLQREIEALKHPKVSEEVKKSQEGVVFRSGKVIIITDTELIKAGIPGIYPDAVGVMHGYNLNTVRCAVANAGIIKTIEGVAQRDDIKANAKNTEIDRLKATMESGGWSYSGKALTDKSGHRREVIDIGAALKITQTGDSWGDVDAKTSALYKAV